MCGIVGYIGKSQALPVLVGALKLLAYRGYDSAGIATIHAGALRVCKTSGKIAALEHALVSDMFLGTVGIGHTRWATHGKPTEVNAHPHVSMSGRIAVVHNGTIENFASLRGGLERDEFVFVSDTDTEVLPHLIERELRNADSLENAVTAALSYVEGAYAIAVISADHPNTIVVARNSSPLVVGFKEAGEFFLASDENAIAEHVRSVMRLNDGEVVSLCFDSVLPEIRGCSAAETTARLEKTSVSPEVVGCGRFAHYMQKEILEQPRAIADALRGRLRADDGLIKLGGIDPHVGRICGARRIIIAACGTSYYAALAGKMLIERLARLPVEVVLASEFQYSDPILDHRDVLIAISQSGETADTLRAVELGKKRGALCLGITNKVGSAIARAVDAGSYLKVGPEYAVASTKAFTSQVTVLLLIALRLAIANGGGSSDHVAKLMHALEQLPALVGETLLVADKILELAEMYADAGRIILIGRGFSVPLIYEGALKLKEIAYIDAMGYAAGELKHGPLALVESRIPIIAIVESGELLHKMLSNMQEVKARGGHVIAFAVGGEAAEAARRVAMRVIELPDVPEELIPIVCAPVLQLLAYHVGVLRGNDVDQPRNLAKSVTVE